MLERAKHAKTIIIKILHTTQYPTQRNGHTEIIADDRGHLNNPRLRSARSPWGDYLGTWQRPRKEIQLKVKTKLMSQQFQSQVVQSPLPRQVSQENEELSQSAPGTPTTSSKLQCSTPTADQQEKSNSASSQRAASSRASYSVSQSSQRAQSASASSRKQSTSRGDTPSRGTSSVRETSSRETPSRETSSRETPSRGMSSAQSHRSSRSTSQTAISHSSRQSSRAKSANSSQSRPQSRMCDDGEASGIGLADASRVYTPVSVSSRPSSSHHGLSTAESQHRNAAVQCPTPTSST